MTETTHKLEKNSEFQTSQLWDGRENIENEAHLSTTHIVQSSPDEFDAVAKAEHNIDPYLANAISLVRWLNAFVNKFY